MRLEEIGILEKVNLLEAAIAKADLELDYSITVAWGDNVEETKTNMKNIIKQVRELYTSGRMDSMDLDVRASTYANFNTLVDSCLRKFPEYALEKDIFKPKSF